MNSVSIDIANTESILVSDHPIGSTSLVPQICFYTLFKLPDFFLCCLADTFFPAVWTLASRGYSREDEVATVTHIYHFSRLAFVLI